ncbi:hypothetical protein D1872_217390 [compost metagenome]
MDFRNRLVRVRDCAQELLIEASSMLIDFLCQKCSELANSRIVVDLGRCYGCAISFIYVSNPLYTYNGI